ncbi:MULTISPECIES: isoleucine--tRNA ligase [Sphingobium]|jgi:isoleucyl-tRNA synthetase|uniref:isoleucine--tRNA ligase n=1 Tax=Sphingobium TaxID=165695 RepID=UPI000DBB22CB|nr:MULTISPECIES: isoleucine--tRNA ligase [Sphingobium]KAA9017690.1 isoleucine--tRNA ligase [Sphingobium limneticum]MBU0932300.1 isoleucine--tRNA ligase [Alphaproteobacteria bacterium]BBD00203.1 isoleucyl-tRNA synthetase [Sphingobium sp. YG1]
MTDQPDYKSTVFLPVTDFPMKAGLAQKEPAIAAKWAAMDLYGKLREKRAGRERFILHDGPPYANGDIHMGHAMNKVLKDIIVRSQSLLGKDAPYVPGWDCHGLPIEWKIEEEYRKKKLNKDEVPAAEFRAQCRAYADKWVDVQKEQFKRLGVMGDWADPYLTMKFDAEATIVGELLKFAESGQLYRGAKPVMWSPVEKTALAEAEVEYEDVTSTQIDVAFEIVEAPNAPELVGAHAVIWTTTPWTIPVNQAIAYGEGIEYLLVTDGQRNYVIAALLFTAFATRFEVAAEAGLKLWQVTSANGDPVVIGGTDLAGAIARHPMHALGGFFAKPRPLLPADHVTTDAGTGLVHMAPDHGEEDFIACKKLGIDPVFAVNDAGFYRDDWDWLPGQGSVINTKFNGAEGPICTDLRAVGALLSASDFRHSYPHSWRSKARIIYRCTPQWFIPMDKPQEGGVADVDGGVMPTAVVSGNGPTLREIAVDAIEHTRWVPERSTNRIRSMVEGRPDWVISRQRAWGVPIALYVHRKSGQYLVDPAVNARIIDAFKGAGADAWFGADHQALLGPDYDLNDYEVVNDILDVWFDSGSTHSFVVEGRYGEGTRADLYIEGSDQHRGWFQSSLLESCGTRGQAPYKAVLTHGFALDGTGKKMSKSLGNVVDPLKIMAESGADILRVWVASTDYFDDVRIGKEVLAGSSDAYRKLRNTFRYMLGALSDYDEESEAVSYADMPELERYMLHRLAQLDAELRAVVDKATKSENWLEFSRYTRAIFDFANSDLSAFFFDIRKDCLYCDAKSDPKRRAYRTLLDTLFHALVRYVAPIIPFTAEEVWQSRFPNEEESVHFLEWPEIDTHWINGGLDDKWTELRNQREQVNEAIEPLRREKIVRSSLDADVTMGELLPVGDVDFAEVAIVARVTMGEGDGIVVTPSEWHKCGRCWRKLPEVTEDGTLCDRCDEVLKA